MSPIADSEAANRFVEVFCQALGSALQSTTGMPWRTSQVEQPEISQSGAVQLYQVHVQGRCTGDFYLEIPRAQAVAIATSGQKPEEAASNGFSTMLREAIRSFQLELNALHGTVTLRMEPAAEVAPSLTRIAPVAAENGGGQHLSLLMYFSQELIDSLDQLGSGQNQEPNVSTLTTEPASVATDANLNLIMDVELNLTLRFGQRKLPLREVLELASGSVVELDRQVDEPVELLLGDKVIARGEAVIVDGNYGLRVTEVPQAMASQIGR